MKTLLPMSCALLLLTSCHSKPPAPSADPSIQLSAGKAVLSQSIAQLTDLSTHLRNSGTTSDADLLDEVIASTRNAGMYFDAGLRKVDDLTTYYTKQHQTDQAAIASLQSDQTLRAWMDILAGAGGFSAAIGVGLLIFLGAALRGVSLATLGAGLAALAIGVFVRESLPYANFIVIPGVIVLGAGAAGALGYGLYVAVRAIRENLQQMRAAKLPIAGVATDPKLNAFVSLTTRRLNAAMQRQLR